VILLSGAEPPEGLALTAYLAKPVRLAELVALVRSVLQPQGGPS
jgi:hypothetical protein